VAAQAPHPVTTDHPERSRFEVTVDGDLAGYAEYVRKGNGPGAIIDFTHTKVDDRFEGQGVGSALIRAALETVRERGEQALPHCPFVRAYIGRHPEYVDLVPAARRAMFGLDQAG
jgi:predicted GNAT family acetyltransferase